MALSRLVNRVTGSWALFFLMVMSFMAAPLAAQNSTPRADQPVVVNGTEITWSGEWEYDADDSYSVASVSEQAMFVQKDEDIDDQIGYVTLLSYGVLEQSEAADSSEAVQIFAELLLEGASPNALEQSASGESAGGGVWGLYAFTPSAADDIQGQSIASLIAVSENDEGAFIVTSLTSPIDLFHDAINQAQNDFRLDGDGRLFEGIDVDDVVEDLHVVMSPGSSRESTPSASPEISVADIDAATPGASPQATPIASPNASPAPGAEATLAAEQDLAETPESTPSN